MRTNFDNILNLVEPKSYPLEFDPISHNSILNNKGKTIITYLLLI